MRAMANQSDKDNKLWEAVSLCSGPLGVSPSLLAQWKSRGYVPPSVHYDLAQVALELGVTLNQRELHAQWKRVKRNGRSGDLPQF